MSGGFTAVEQCHQDVEPFLEIVVGVNGPVFLELRELIHSVLDIDCSRYWDPHYFVVDGPMQRPHRDVHPHIPMRA